VLESGREVTSAGPDGVAVVGLRSGTTVLVLALEGPIGHGTPHFSCARASGRLRGRSLGPVRLGMTRSQTRRLFTRGSTRGRRDMDFFCPAHEGIRVGYAPAGLLTRLGPGARRRLRGRVVLVLTANRHDALRGVRPGESLARAARRLHAGRGFHVGRNLVVSGARRSRPRRSQVRHGVIGEIGIADPALTGTRGASRRFFTSFL